MEERSVILDAICLASKIILESGGETYRAEETVEHMCSGFNVPNVDVLALPTGLMLTMVLDDDSSVSRIVRVRHRSTDLSRVDACNHISRQVAAGNITPREALDALKSIRLTPGSSYAVMLIAGAMSSGFFTVMLGGGWMDFIVSFFLGGVVQFMLPFLSRHRVPSTVSGLMAGFLATLLAVISTLFLPHVNVEPIISGAILPLLPGLATTNAIRDTIRGDLVSGGARITEAALSALMLATGICIALSIWGGIAV